MPLHHVLEVYCWVLVSVSIELWLSPYGWRGPRGLMCYFKGSIRKNFCASSMAGRQNQQYSSHMCYPFPNVCRGVIINNSLKFILKDDSWIYSISFLYMFSQSVGTKCSIAVWGSRNFFEHSKGIPILRKVEYKGAEEHWLFKSTLFPCHSGFSFFPWN